MPSLLSTARSPLLLVACLAGVAPAGAQGPAVLVATRDLHIDAATANFSSAGSLLVARNGDILVIDDKENIFRTFNASGPTGTIGREGEGPGEFKNLRSAGWLGDSLWVYDFDLKRFSIFGPTHKFVRSFRPPTAFSVPNAPADTTPVEPYFQALLPDGSLRTVITYRPNHPPSWAAGVDSGSSLIVRATPAGVVKNRITIIPPDKCAISGSNGHGSYWNAYIPFCNGRISTDWNEVPNALVARVDLIAGDPKTPSYRLTVVDEKGTALINRIYPFMPVTVAKAAIDSSVAARQKQFARMPPDYLAFALKVAPAHDYPPIRRIVSGLDGTTWLEERVAQPGHHWKILDPKGGIIGIVTLPDNIALQAANLQTIWGYEVDADGLQGLVRFHLDRSKG